MTTATYKAPVNFRASPVRVGSPEAFTIAGGLALLAEAPGDPASYAITVIVNGTSRTRVTTSPGVGQYRILTQGATFLPVLQFNIADDGRSGTVDYYGTGTILTAQFFSVLLSFLMPMMLVDESALPAPTMDVTKRGRPGDVAFLSTGPGLFSDGTAWLPFTGTSTGSTGLTFGQTVALALEAGYVGPSFTDNIPVFASVFSAVFDGEWAAAGVWNGTTTLSQVLGMTFGVVQAEVGALTVNQTLAMTMDAALGFLGAPDNFAATFATTLDGSWAEGVSRVTAFDDFNRANNASLGSNWNTAYGRGSFGISGGVAAPNANGATGAVWNASFTGDQYSEAIIQWPVQAEGTSNVTAILGTCVAVRMQPNANSFYCAAGYITAGASGTRRVMLGKVIDGVFTNLTEVVTVIAISVIRLEVWGTTLLVRAGATSGPNVHDSLAQCIMFTDTSLSGGAPGIVSDGVVGNDYIDFWYGGDMYEWYDVFDRSNGALGYNWSILTGSPWAADYPQIASARGACLNTSAAAISNPATFAADQYAETSFLSGMIGPAVRMSSSQGYFVTALPSGDDGDGSPTNIQVTLWKWNGASFTSLTSDSSAPANEIIIKITAQGNTFKVYTAANRGLTYTQRISFTDTSYPSGGAPGFVSKPLAGGSSSIDTFYGGNL